MILEAILGARGGYVKRGILKEGERKCTGDERR
jgi:hypothetical protein